MIVIQNINAQKFRINGIPYYKNFTAHAHNETLRIVNVYDTKFVLADFNAIGNYSVDGSVYGNAQDLCNALLPVLYTRSNLGDSIEIDLSSKLETGGYIGTAQILKDEIDAIAALEVSDKTYLHVQGTPASTWIVTHLLSKYPSVTVIDSAGTTVEGAVEYADLNNLTITFNASFSGSATIN